MWDPDILEACKCTAEDWKKIFDKPRGTKYSGKTKELLDLIKSRIQAGIDFNLTNHAHYHALDLAWDSPFQQISPTLIQSFVDKPVTGTQAEETLKSWGIDVSDLFESVPDPKTPDKSIRRMNAPALVKIVPPLVKAYLTMRWAKIVNDDNLTPLDKYDPSISDELSMMRAEALTHRAEVMNQQMGSFETRKDAVWRMLHYSEAFLFPVEEWYREEQIHDTDSKVDGEDFLIDGNKVGTRVLVREGIRHHMPHPTRTFRDQAHFASTFNLGIGCRYAGYWRVVTYGDIIDNKDLYNTDNISYGTRDWSISPANTYLTNVYKGCVMNFPNVTENQSGGVSKHDSEKHVGDGFYNREERDKAVLQTEYFEKLVPKDWDLGDYDCPVWVRFVLASDNTVMYAAPVCYDPVIYYGYDNPGGRTLNASMTLEILPFQDQIGNLLTQLLINIRQNLTNLVLIDTDQIDEKMVGTLQNLGERWYRKINILGFAGLKSRKFNQNPGQAIISQRFPQLDTNGPLIGIKTVLDLLERALVMSSQEVAQAASHEQTREEIRNVAGNSSTRLQFTTLGVDAAHEAHKKQNYQGLMAYGAESFYVQLPLNPLLTEEELTKLGFTVISKDPKTGKAKVKVKKTAIMYETFVANRDGADRVNDMATATAMLSMFKDVILPNQELMQALGVEQIIQNLNYIAKKAGFPRDFKLKTSAEQQDPNAAVPVAVQQMVDTVAKHIEDGVKGSITQLGDMINQQGQQVAAQGQQMQSFQGALQNLLAASQAAPPIPSPNALDTIQPQFTPGGPAAQFDPMAGVQGGIQQPAQAVPGGPY